MPVEQQGSYELAESLERSTAKLQSRLRDHFVDDRSLCVSCKWSHVYRQSSRNERVVYCGQLSRNVPSDIEQCSEYRTVNSLSLHQMAEMATLIDITERKVGFHG